MKKVIRLTGKVFDRLLDIMALLSMVIISFVTLSVCAGVFSRFFLNRPFTWVAEISEYSLVYITFLVAAWVLRSDGHVKMDIVFNQFSPKNRTVMSLWTSIVAALACLIATLYGVKVTRYLHSVHYYTPTVLELPKFIMTAIIPVGFFLLFVQLVRNVFRHGRDLITSNYMRQEETPTIKIEDVR